MRTFVGSVFTRLGEIVRARGRLERRADEGTNLSRRFVRLVLHRAHEALHARRHRLCTCHATYACRMTRRPSRVPESCKPLDVVRSRRSTGIVDSNGIGQRHARPGSSSTRTGLPKRVTTVASPERTCTRLAVATANNTRMAAIARRRSAGSAVPQGCRDGHVDDHVDDQGDANVPQFRSDPGLDIAIGHRGPHPPLSRKDADRSSAPVRLPGDDRESRALRSTGRAPS